MTQPDVSWLPRVSTEQGSLLVPLRWCRAGVPGWQVVGGVGGGDDQGMAKTRKVSDKLGVAWDRECRDDCEGVRGCALVANVLCVLETLSWRTSLSQCAICLGGPRGMRKGMPGPSPGWALVNAVKGLGSRGRPDNLIALLVLPPFGFDTVNTHRYLAV